MTELRTAPIRDVGAPAPPTAAGLARNRCPRFPGWTDGTRATWPCATSPSRSRCSTSSATPCSGSSSRGPGRS
ncbi:hypothetical protein ACFQX7_28790 [Luedemannella flava]